MLDRPDHPECGREPRLTTHGEIALSDPALSDAPLSPWSDAVEARAVAAGVTLSFIGIATFLLMPQFVEAVVSDLHFTEGEAGWMSSAVMIGSTVAAAASGIWIRRIPWQRAAAVALIGQLLANGLGLVAHTPAVFIGLQALVGFFGGSLYSLSLTILSDGRRPDRNFAYSIGAQTLYQLFGLAAGPYLIRHGADAMLLLFAVLCIAGLGVLAWVPARGRALTVPGAGGSLLNVPVLLTLAGCFAFYINIGAYWTYVERIGTAGGMSIAATSSALALAVTMSVAGVVLAFWLGDRRGYLGPLAASAAAIVFAMVLLTGTLTVVAYTASAIVYGIAWNVSMTYQYTAVNAVDRSGRGVALAPALHWAGGAAGPALAALVVTDRNHDAVYGIVVAAVVASLGLFAVALRVRASAARTA